MLRRLMLATAVAAAALVPAPAAHAAARVTVANAGGDAVVDPTYATSLTLSGSGFQSIRGGHGGIYVFFGAVGDGWRPSQGGATGEDYFYVPDSESADNQGFQRFVAFPGSDTAGSANGGTISAAGRWSTTLMVPGAVFEAYDRDGGSRRIDCRRTTCGVITVGAHGVTNARNETFTPVRVESLVRDGESPTGGPSPSGTTTAGSSSAPPSAPTTGPQGSAGAGSTDGPGAPAVPSGPAALEVDRASARAGNVLAFAGSGLPAGRQVTVVLDDGAAASGPFLVGSDGRMAGVVRLPAGTPVGTHTLRVFGVDDPPAVSFAVAEAVETAAARVDAASDDSRAAVVFVAASALVLLVCAVRLVWRYRRSRRASS